MRELTSQTSIQSGRFRPQGGQKIQKLIEPALALALDTQDTVRGVLLSAHRQKGQRLVLDARFLELLVQLVSKEEFLRFLRLRLLKDRDNGKQAGPLCGVTADSQSEP